MKYTVYTDAASSTEKGLSGCAYVIFTDDMYISSDSVKVVATTNPTHAEVVSIGLAAACLIDDEALTLSKEDSVEFYSDCFSAITFCQQCLGNLGNIPSGSKVVRNSIIVLRRLAKVSNVTFQKVRGHKDRTNPNTFVDRLAKLPVRRE